MLHRLAPGEPLGLLALLGGGVLALGFCVAAAAGIGDFNIPLRTVFLAVTNNLDLTAAPLDRIEESVVWNLRLSRALVAALCGAGLAICGAILQSLLRNPLAEPFVLGVSAGASTGAVAVIVLGIGAGAVSLSFGAFAGAFAAFGFVALLSNGTVSGPNQTILAGVAAWAVMQGLVALLV